MAVPRGVVNLAFHLDIDHVNENYEHNVQAHQETFNAKSNLFENLDKTNDNCYEEETKTNVHCVHSNILANERGEDATNNITKFPKSDDILLKNINNTLRDEDSQKDSDSSQSKKTKQCLKLNKFHIKLITDLEICNIGDSAMEENDSTRSDNYDSSQADENSKIKKGELVFDEIVCDEELVHRFTGSFRSFREQAIYKSWRRRSLGEELKMFRKLKESSPELNRSQYSLVSCTELTPGAVQLWLGLPEEVKYDPALAQFRQLYEKEYGKDNSNKSPNAKGGRLPLVSSAPHLNNNLQCVDSSVEFQTKPQNGVKEPQPGSPQPPKESRMARARHLTKMCLLLACWVFFTAVFLMYNEREEVIRNSFVSPGEMKQYLLPDNDQVSVLLKLSGPFLSETGEQRLNDSQLEAATKLDVWLEGAQKFGNVTGGVDKTLSSEPWRIVLLEDPDLDFSEGEQRSKVLHLNSSDASVVSIRLRTNSNATVPLRLEYKIGPLDIHTGVIYSSLLLCALYVLIIFEIINRTMAAVLVSTTALATLALTGERPSIPEVISWLDAETLLLLFSMMLLVAIMAETGMFDFLAVFTFEVTKGKLWPLITVLCFITAFLSTFLDNVTTVLLMTPVTIRLCEVMDLDPVPILMSMVLFSNIGGTATPVGDPPNVIIASNKAVIQAGVNFTNFTLHMTLGILLVCVQTYVQLRFMFRDTNKMRLCVPRDIQELRHQISIWRRAADSLPHLSKDEHIVKERLERKVRKLQVQLDTLVKESSKRACPKDTFQSTLVELKDKYKIRDKALLVKATVAICFVVTVFFLHSIPELNRVSLGWTALLGALLLLLLADREDLEPILHRVEWSTLLFFAALFVLMEALSKLGLIEFIGGVTESIILKVDESSRLAVALILLLWVSGLSSAFVDNIPLTTMMVRVVTSLGSNPHLGLPMAPLIWALCFGACLGGNGTLIGASANVVCAGVAEQHGYKFTFMHFFRIGFPIMIGHLVVATGYLLLCHCVFTWH